MTVKPHERKEFISGHKTKGKLVHEELHKDHLIKIKVTEALTFNAFGYNKTRYAPVFSVWREDSAREARAKIMEQIKQAISNKTIVAECDIVTYSMRYNGSLSSSLESYTLAEDENANQTWHNHWEEQVETDIILDLLYGKTDHFVTHDIAITFVKDSLAETAFLVNFNAQYDQMLKLFGFELDGDGIPVRIEEASE